MKFITILLTTYMVTKLAFSANQSTVSIVRCSFHDFPLVVRAIFSDFYHARFYQLTSTYATNYDTFSSMQLRDTI